LDNNINNKDLSKELDVESLLVGGPAFEEMLSKMDIQKQFDGIRKEILVTKSPSKKDDLIKKLKYLDGLRKGDVKPQTAFIIRNIPVAPPLTRPALVMGNNKIEYADVNNLYKDHMLVNNSFKDIKDYMPNDQLVRERKDLYEGAKSIFGLGDAITGSSRGPKLKGFIRQVSGTSGPKQGYFHSKLLSKKLDFSGRGTIYAEPNLGFNEAAIPEEYDMDYL